MSYAQYKRVFGKIFIYVGFLALFIGSLLLILKLIVDPERWRGDIETLLKNHINEGREHVNFSEWGNYSSEKQNEIKKDCKKELIENEMPLSSYTFMHSDAKLDESRETLLADWFNKGVIVNENESGEEND